MRVTTPHALAMATVVAFAACGNEPLVPDDPNEGLTGTWTFIIDVTVANGICAGEESAPHDTSQVSVVQVGDSVTATGPWGSTSGSETLAGSRNGNVVILVGAYDEDGGTTVTTHTLNVTGADVGMNGTEDWEWFGPGGPCAGGRATVQATKNSP